jgi:hypothetical protein
MFRGVEKVYSQVVAGMNYRFILQFLNGTASAKPVYYQVTVFV